MTWPLQMKLKREHFLITNFFSWTNEVHIISSSILASKERSDLQKNGAARKGVKVFMFGDAIDSFDRTIKHQFRGRISDFSATSKLEGTD